MAKNVTEQINALKRHPLVRKLEAVGARLIKLIFAPKTKSQYSCSEYRLKIDLPLSYPEDPPSIKFIDQIEHVNVCPQTGAISMPLLAEDWSPYLSLYCILDSVDLLLSQPEMDPLYCSKGKETSHASKSRGLLRKNSLSETANNLLKPRKLSRTISKVSVIPSVFEDEIAEEQIVREVEEVSEEREGLYHNQKKKRLKRLKTLILASATDCHQFEEKTSVESEKKTKPLTPDLSNIWQLPEDHSRNKSQLMDSIKSPYFGSPTARTVHPMSPILSESILDCIKYKNAAKHEQLSFPTPVRHFEEDGPREMVNPQLNNTVCLELDCSQLKRLNCLLRTFYMEYEQLLKRQKLTSSPPILKILDERTKQQFAMIEQLQALSASLKRQMMANVKQQVRI